MNTTPIYFLPSTNGMIPLGFGEYRGIRYMIGTICGRYPVAYIENFLNYSNLEVANTDLNTYSAFLSKFTEFTYLDECYWNVDDFKTYLGWDYAHEDDFNAQFPENDKIRHTYCEIMSDVKQVIDALIRIRKVA